MPWLCSSVILNVVKDPEDGERDIMFERINSSLRSE
jgi:hypothetical protein